jgi:hypothetical protein
MTRRMLLLMSVVLAAAMHTQAMGQNVAVPSANDLKAALQDDAQFSQLMTEVWVVRDLLALQQGGDISAQIKDFQGLQDQVRSHRNSIVDTISSDPARIEVKSDVQSSADSVAASLDRFGVRADSELGKRLGFAFVMFNQVVSAASLDSPCKIYPFQEVC